MKKEEKLQGFHWGWGITVAIILGVSAMIFLVYKSSQVDFDMVMDDYYEQEIDYEPMFQAQKRLERLSTPFEVHQSEDWLILQFPLECLNHVIDDGVLEMYRPASKAQDLVIPFELDEDAQIVLDKSRFVSGQYTLKGNWTMDGERYNINRAIYINL